MLVGNNMVKQCEGGWRFPVVLTSKPHQEVIDDIYLFVWLMCVSYRQLNQVTNPFEYPIGRFNTAIEDLVDAAGELLFCV